MPATWNGTPRDWNAGLLVTSSIANQEWRDRFMYLKDSPTIDGTPTITGAATFTAAPVFSSATASQALFTNGSKALVSNAITGSGNVVMSASPTLTGTIGAASMTLSGTFGVTGVATFTALPVFSTPLTTLGTIATGVWNAGAVTSSGAVTGTTLIPSGSSAPTNGVYLPAANVLGFATNSTDRMRLLSTGAVVVNGTAAVSSSQLAANFDGSTAVANGFALNDTNSTASTTFARFLIGGSIIGSIDRVGSTSAVVYNTTSDAREKSTITPFSDALARVDQIAAGEFTWLASGERSSGVIAQQLYPIYPDAVTPPKTNADRWRVDYGRLTPLLIGAVQELSARLRALETRV